MMCLHLTNRLAGHMVNHDVKMFTKQQFAINSLVNRAQHIAQDVFIN